MTRAALAAVGLCLSMTPGCGDGAATAGGTAGGAPTSDATALACPAPGALPFVTESQGFSSPDNQLTADGSDCNKDEASDTLGLDGGPAANTYAALDAASTTGDLVYVGKKARTGQASGLSSIPLRGEAVSLWYFDDGAKRWSSLGRAQTDDDGMYSITPAGAVVAPGRPVYAVLEADGSCAEHFDFVYPAGTRVVVADIDGTLTASDDELVQQINDGLYVPTPMGSAAELTNAWADKGYRFVYVTARPHLFRAESRAWLESLGFAPGPLLTAPSIVVDDAARAYKAAWLARMQSDFQWEVVAAYGNAQSDIDAYAEAGVPKETTFIVGPLAGADGTQPIPNADYAAHIAAFVDAQPDTP